jgi:arylsulfatase A-like enzyme
MVTRWLKAMVTVPLSSGNISGIFVDSANIGVGNGQWMSCNGKLPKAKSDVWNKAHMALLPQAQKIFDSNGGGVVLANNHDIKGVNGRFFEQFVGGFDNFNIKSDIKKLQSEGVAKRYTECHGSGPANSKNNLSFVAQLAAFLLGAHDRAFFYASIGWSNIDGEGPLKPSTSRQLQKQWSWTAWHDELSRPLGRPLEPMRTTKHGQGEVLSRRFAKGTNVSIYCKSAACNSNATAVPCIQWADHSVSGDCSWIYTRPSTKSDDAAMSSRSGAATAMSWASHPALPGEHVILQGEGLPAALSVDGASVPALQRSARSAKLRLPAGRNRMFNVSAAGASIGVNWPEVSFFHRFDVFAGGEILAFGRSLAFDSRTGHCLSDGADSTRRAPLFDWEAVAASGCGGAGNYGCGGVEAQLVSATDEAKTVDLVVADASCYKLKLSIPTSAPAGIYYLRLKNGLADASGGRAFSDAIAESDGEAPGPVVFSVAAAKPPASWPQQVFIADPDYEYRFTNASGPCSPTGCLIIRRGNLSEALEAAAANGGGIVTLLPGSFRMNATAAGNAAGYMIPPRTKVVGVKDRSALVFPAMLNKSQIPTLGFIYGADFEMHNLSVYCGPGKFGTVFSILQNSTHALFDGLFVRANPYAGIGSPGGPRWPNNTDHEGRFSYDTHVSMGGAIKILGNYTTFRNSDLYMAGHWFIIVGQGGINARGTVLERNRLSYASGLFYFCGSSRSIISNNLIFGIAPASQNSAFATYGEARTDMLAAVNNAFTNPSSGASAGSLTEDGAGGAYNDTLAAVSADGRTLTLKSTPRIGDQHFIGGAVYVLAGRGAGQFRRIVAHTGNASSPGLQWTLSSRFAISLDASDGPDASFVAIGPYRGKFLWVGNVGVDNQGMWLWGSSINVILADNVLSRSQAFVLWPQDEKMGTLGPAFPFPSDAPQPNFRVQVLNNRIATGMTYDHGRWECAIPGSAPSIAGQLPPCAANEIDQDGPREYLQPGAGPQPAITVQSASYNSTSSKPQLKNIPLTRALIIKGNRFESDANIVFGAESVADVLVEHNAIANTEVAMCIEMQNGNRGLNSVLIGANELSEGLMLQCMNCAMALRGGHAAIAGGKCTHYPAPLKADDDTIAHSIPVATAPPHLIFYVVDDLGWNDLGFQNDALAGQRNKILSPHIDALARDGIRLLDYSSYKFCSPARSQFLTGRYAYHLGQQTQYNLGSNSKACAVSAEYDMLPRMLKRHASYITRAYGKWHQGFYKPMFVPTSRGFDSFLGDYDSASDKWTHVVGSIANAPYWWTPQANKTWPLRTKDGCGALIDLANDSATTGIQPASFALNGTHSTDYITERLLLDIQTHPRQGSPLFAYVAFNSVHTALEAPAEYIRRYDGIISDPDRKVLGAMVSQLDDSIGRVENALKKKGFWNTTLTIFTTDNGGPVCLNMSKGTQHKERCTRSCGTNNWPLRVRETTHQADNPPDSDPGAVFDCVVVA